MSSRRRTRSRRRRATTAGSVGAALLLLVALASSVVRVSSSTTATTATPLPLHYEPGGLQSGPDPPSGGGGGHGGRSTFASSVAYSADDHTVTVAGATLGRYFDGGGASAATSAATVTRCFLATATLPDAASGAGSGGGGGEEEEGGPSGGMRWTVRQVVVSPSSSTVPETCSSLALDRNRNKLIAIGRTERQGGLLSSLYNPSGYVQPVQMGVVLDLELSSTSGGGAASTTGTSPHYPLTGGRLMQEAPVTYPVALHHRPGTDYVYVAAQETDSTARYDQDDSMPGPNLVDPERFFVYGDSYRLAVSRYVYKDARFVKANGDGIRETFDAGVDGTWRKIHGASDGESIHVAGIAELKGIVVVAGATAGFSDVLGGADAASRLTAGDSLDGFVTKFDAATGEPALPANRDERQSVRIQSLDAADDWIVGLCHHRGGGGGDAAATAAGDAAAEVVVDEDHVYIVGSTQGRVLGNVNVPGGSSGDDVAAFLMKLRVDTLETVWTATLAAARQSGGGGGGKVRGVSCAVTPDGGAVWWGGVVQDGAVLDDGAGTAASYGANDVFVGKVLSADGRREFVRQFGTIANDDMAMRGGLAVDRDGNAIVVGNTFGSLYRQRSQQEEGGSQQEVSDVFVMTVARDNGAIAPPLFHPEYADHQGGSENHPEQPANQGSNNSGGGNNGNSGNQQGSNGDNNKDTLESSSVGKDGSDSSSSDDGGMEKWVGLLIVLIVASATTMLAAFYVGRHVRQHRETCTDRSKVLEFLHDFEVEDVDLKHSATGGWHCSYTGDLAEGRVVHRKRLLLGDDSSRSRTSTTSRSSRSGYDPLMMGVPHSSILEDSLFMVDDDDDVVDEVETGSDSNSGSDDGLRNSLMADDGDDDGADMYVASSSSGNGSRRRSSGYDSLVDAYNNTWDDRSASPRRTGRTNRREQWGKDIV